MHIEAQSHGQTRRYTWRDITQSLTQAHTSTTDASPQRCSEITQNNTQPHGGHLHTPNTQPLSESVSESHAQAMAISTHIVTHKATLTVTCSPQPHSSHTVYRATPKPQCHTHSVSVTH